VAAICSLQLMDTGTTQKEEDLAEGSGTTQKPFCGVSTAISRNTPKPAKKGDAVGHPLRRSSLWELPVSRN
jgi:hypothetical protein